MVCPSACQAILRGGATLLLHVRPLLILSAAMLVMVACTRERPLPDPTATAAILVSAPATAATEAQIVTDTPVAGASSSEAGLAVTNTPSSLTPAANGTPAAGTPATY